MICRASHPPSQPIPTDREPYPEIELDRAEHTVMPTTDTSKYPASHDHLIVHGFPIDRVISFRIHKPWADGSNGYGYVRSHRNPKDWNITDKSFYIGHRIDEAVTESILVQSDVKYSIDRIREMWNILMNPKFDEDDHGWRRVENWNAIRGI